ncbi:putative 3-hydroxyisobutyryl-CoA hydrolase 3, partial [Mucuna pruriens]
MIHMLESQKDFYKLLEDEGSNDISVMELESSLSQTFTSIFTFVDSIFIVSILPLADLTSTDRSSLPLFSQILISTILANIHFHYSCISSSKVLCKRDRQQSKIIVIVNAISAARMKGEFPERIGQPECGMYLFLNEFIRCILLVPFTRNSCLKKVILNRPQKLNNLNREMGNGKAFCSGGDILLVITSSLAGHWTYAASFYKKQLTLNHLITTYKKPMLWNQVSLINGLVMGGGAGLSIPTWFRVVTELGVAMVLKSLKSIGRSLPPKNNFSS